MGVAFCTTCFDQLRRPWLVGQAPAGAIYNTLLRITGDNSALNSPAGVLSNPVAQSIEDDVSLIWLADQTQTTAAVKMLQSILGTTGGGEDGEQLAVLQRSGRRGQPHS